MTRAPKVRQRAKRDENHNDIVRVFETMLASWLELSALAGALDGIVGVSGIDQRVEIKDGNKPPSKRRLTPVEQEVFDAWQGRKPVIIYTVDDAVALVNKLRREA